ncbi:MAG: T9SS type A sorting domain-containing protein, partial [Chitinophagales bacterium]
ERVADIALQPDGKILVAGKLSMINGVPVFQIARLLSDGSLDPDFMIPESSSDINSIETILLQGDGKIIIGGDFSTINGASRKNIARLNADGTVDISFSTGSGFNGIVYCLAQQDDGKIIAGGAFKKYQSTILHGLARLHSNGELDVSFTNLALDNGFYVYSVAIQPDGKIVMAGEFENAGGINMDNIVRRNADGTHDLTFIGPSDALFQLADIELLADNTILAGGDFSEFEGTEVQGIVNLNADGSLNTGFYLNLVNYRDEYITDITLNADGDIFICGALKEFGFTTKNHIAKLHGTETDCVTPTGLYANELTSSSAKVHWNIVPLAIKYTIQYKPLGTTTWSKKSSVSNFKTLNSLLSNTTYEFRVRTLCEEGPTSYSSIEQFTTLPLKEGELQNSEQVIMSVYPNPTNSVLFIETGNLTDQIQIEITNMFSKKMLQFSASASETVQVDVSQFPAGVYVVNIFAEDQSSTEKFIKL